MTDAQRVQLALLLKPGLEKQAKAQQGKRNDILQNSGECSKPIRVDKEIAKAAGGDKRSGKAVIQKSGEPIRVDKEIAKAAGVSHDTVAKVSKVLDTGTEELKGAMLAGAVSVNTAAKAAARDGATVSSCNR